MEELLCIGCGATIQTEDKGKLGYTPQSALEKGLETGELYCQRCFRLRHYNEISDVQLTDDDFLRLLHEVGDSDALVVNVVDIFDFNEYKINVIIFFNKIFCEILSQKNLPVRMIEL